MKVTVKTLTGRKFPIEADDSSTVAAVKGIIEAANAELPAASMKLIHSGKVLKDEDILSTVGIKENDFLVVMITKKKAAPKTPAPQKEEEAAKAPAAAAATSTSASTPAPAAASTPAASTAAATTSTATASTTTPAAATPAPTSTTATTPAAPTQPAISDAAVENLVGMGFPEEAVRHCMRVAQGNPDLAVEFLTNGIPEGMEQAMQAAAARGGTTPASSGGTASTTAQPLQALRNHPQFNDLRRLVQSNPQMLQQVLTQIGQQQPDLLQEINANQALFLQMMNEPIQEGSSGGGGSSSAAPTAGASSSPAGGENPFAGGMGNPMQMAQMIQSMNPEELGQMAQMMGVSTEQLRTTAQMIGQMPPEQLNQFIMQAMGGGDGGMESMFGGGGAGGAPGGGQVLRLTDEEMAAVDRLTEMGFDRAEAAQAFLACDKNEALAANLLMDSMMGDDSGGGNQGGGGDNNGGGGADDDEDMYD
uniref:UV excision repair protein RAD23 n=1 Tax=Amphora coffeiformis TaxID=265554 RepID=A0A7S3P0B9_9STRA